LEVFACCSLNPLSQREQVSLLLKDSFIDSFPSREQAFIKVFWFRLCCSSTF
jgi:hypothetical protein